MLGLAEILVLVSMISGIVSVLTDPNASHAKWSKPLLMSFVSIPALASIWLIFEGHVRSTRESDGRCALQIQSTRDTLLKQVQTQTQYCIHDDHDTIDEAHSRSNIIERPAGDGHSIIRFFYRSGDPIGSQILELLQRTGLKVVIARSKDSRKINAIWFGDRVPITDVKVVAKSLLDAGVQIQGIQPLLSQGPDNEWSNQIQIVHDKDYSERQSLSRETVQNASGFGLDGLPR
jgi:hypothetical protein